MTKQRAGSAGVPEGGQRFKRLPERLPLDELSTEHAASEVPDPDALVEPTGDWMHRPF